MPELMRTGAVSAVILIPADGSRLKRVPTTLTAITADNRLHDNIHDARLTHIPEMRVFWYNNTAAFANRVASAAQVYHHPTDPGLNGRYYLIKTLAVDEEGLPLNEHEFWTNIPNRKVWGDAVIFKVGTPQLDEDGRAIHIDVPKSMLNDDGLRVVRDIMTTAACLGPDGVYTLTSG